MGPDHRRLRPVLGDRGGDCPMSPPDQVRATIRLQAATRARRAADTTWVASIDRAHQAGLSHRAIAPLAGVSYQRVGQILKGAHR